MTTPLTTPLVESILRRIPHLTIGVLGDLFLDRYLDLDTTLSEPSLETGLDAFQVVRVRSYPGAAGTVLNNLAALGVGRSCPLAVIGDDGEGYELKQALRRLSGVELDGIFETGERRTPTYTKPILLAPGQPPREWHRLDIKNRQELPAGLTARVVRGLEEIWPQLDALVVLDQVSEADCGVVTAAVRARLAELADADPGRFVLADSRERIGLFWAVWLKPNQAECVQAIHGLKADQSVSAAVCARQLAVRTGRPVFCTCGERGICFVDPAAAPEGELIAGFPVAGPIDIVGAGDSTSAGIACAMAAGASPQQAAAFGNLIASITIQQLGTTGTATPEQVRQRWQEVK